MIQRNNNIFLFYLSELNHLSKNSQPFSYDFISPEDEIWSKELMSFFTRSQVILECSFTYALNFLIFSYVLSITIFQLRNT